MSIDRPQKRQTLSRKLRLLVTGPKEFVASRPFWQLAFGFLVVMGLYVAGYRLLVPTPPSDFADAQIGLWSHYIAQHPEKPDGYVGLGAAYALKGHLSKARDLYLKALQLDPGNASAEYALGHLYLRERSFSEAARAFEMASLKAPKSYQYLSWYYAGIAFESEHSWHHALSAFMRSAASNPVMADTHYHLALCDAALGHRTQALKEIKLALRFDPDNAQLTGLLSKLELEPRSGKRGTASR